MAVVMSSFEKLAISLDNWSFTYEVFAGYGTQGLMESLFQVCKGLSCPQPSGTKNQYEVPGGKKAPKDTNCKTWVNNLQLPSVLNGFRFLYLEFLQTMHYFFCHGYKEFYSVSFLTFSYNHFDFVIIPKEVSFFIDCWVSNSKLSLEH